MVTVLPVFSPFSGLSMNMTPVLVHTSPTCFDEHRCAKTRAATPRIDERSSDEKKHALPVIAGLLTVSAALIAGLASADMKSNCTKKSMIYAKKLDTNADGAISLNELTAHQGRRFAKIDQNSNGLINIDEFNARLVAMFTHMDRNGDGLLRDDELPR